ncbi:iron-containing alcohol dehydrogenase [Bradyrhizobium sp. 40]|jgi:maleylacetate reductase|uniref:iron-containing alcohol dehydrogenase n=2 Tax=Bradyrhizobium TaxID=374 RepID=UPI001FF9EC73|nr:MULTISPECIES: iron-containing alcohol dehydrogenase [unclassified Bradyrhizobium]MCK1399823.1 iron-containing alcohol dehydrogenase [Bradyrhizobium sp. 39]MCK1407742.1 iron-containing alcohol dehydrogenase [Bradyrhizobium sp. 76]MCK1747549.1 iron-containing alcohol dehydrogenase [Bradyrhizobium sp. 135]UPJ33607.1 iron-containing alcohol dehydrogenase [Bradyrhizobium sp. 4]UPJ44268.1 iron-containing alcohol dehydrogenase [Bradyrhizobium sp. 40]
MRKAGIHNFPAIDRVVYGKAASDALNDEAVRLDAKRVFLIVSRTLNTKTDEIEKIRRALGERHVATFDGIAEHTTRKQAADVARQAKDAGADLVAAVGGGSAIDLAKIVIMAMEHDITDEAGFDPFPMGLGVTVSPFRSPKVRQIAVPSTLNGGEYNAAALVTDERNRLKQIFFHPRMMPVAIILDPALTVHTPSKLWMGSGTRSMDHGIEALCSPAGTPLADEVVLAGIRTLREGMLRTLQQPDDLEARRLSQYGAWLAAFGLQARVPMGASHGIGHVLGGTFGVPHYYCTPVIMPSLLRYNKPFTEDAQQRLATALGEPGMEAAAAFAQFTKKLGLPGRLADVGIGEDKFDQISKIAINHRFVQANPRPFKSEAEIVDLLRMAA